MTSVNDKARYKWKLTEPNRDKFTIDIENNLPKNQKYCKRMPIDKLERELRKTIYKSEKNTFRKILPFRQNRG